ncbi:MAG: hypothetical protein AB1566_09065 [Chloroflexota bacterium]
MKDKLERYWWAFCLWLLGMASLGAGPPTPTPPIRILYGPPQPMYGVPPTVKYGPPPWATPPPWPTPTPGKIDPWTAVGMGLGALCCLVLLVTLVAVGVVWYLRRGKQP